MHPTVSATDYKCTNETYHSDPYTCEAGDLGGMFGSFDVGDDQWLNINFTDRYGGGFVGAWSAHDCSLIDVLYIM